MVSGDYAHSLYVKRSLLFSPPLCLPANSVSRPNAQLYAKVEVQPTREALRVPDHLYAWYPAVQNAAPRGEGDITLDD